jgi:hypothetical protein
MSDQWETRADSVPPKQGISPTMIAVIATSVLVLSIVGATGGWLLAGSPETDPSASPTAGPVATSASPKTSPSASPSVSPSPLPSTSKASFGLPDPGTQPFQDYFTLLRSLKLGVDVRFGEAGTAGQVVRTEPAIGSEVTIGKQIHVYVAGDAPQVTVPDVLGVPCNNAKDRLGPAGLFPDYMSGREGVVLQQDPDPAKGGTAKWNDKVQLFCGQPVSPPAAQ